MSRFIIIVTGLTVVIFGWGAAVLKADKVKTHQIIKGDTLWELGETYLEQPLLWPKIWKVNPEINNPHLIFPGQVIRLPELTEKPPAGVALDRKGMPLEKPVDIALPAPLEKTTITVSGVPLPIRILTEVTAPPSDLPLVVTDMTASVYDRGIGTVTFDIPDAGRILRTKQGWGHLGAGETVLIDAPFAVVGQQYGVYRDMGKVAHPARGKSFGHLVADVGIIEVISSDPTGLVAVVKRAFTEFASGDLLGVVPDLPLTVIPAQKGRMISVDGTVIALQYLRSIAVADDIVYIDLGRRDGLAPGDRLVVAERDSSAAKRAAAKIMILRVTENSAAALVLKESQHAIAAGARVKWLL